MTHQFIGRYRILGELGRGASGIVYRAADPLIEREVAIKTLSPNLPADSQADVRERFLREAKSAGRLSHPNIVTVHDVGEDRGIAYIAMELLPGRSLQELMRGAGRLPFARAAELVAQVADALAHAHRLSIIHRDIKPANIMVSPDGRAKLTDFGIAYVPSSSMTQTGTALGSPRYMSPEQARGLKVDARSDIFSLGIVLYELLTGETPFDRGENTSMFVLMDGIIRQPHVPASRVDPGIPVAFDRILARALAKDPEQRYRSAADMAEELRRMLPVVGDAAGSAQLSPGPATAASAAHGAPGVMRPDAAIVTQPAAEDRSGGDGLLQGLDAFSRDYDRARQALQDAEEEQRRRKQESLERWSEAQSKQWLDVAREDKAPAAEAGAPASRRSALRERLRQQAAPLPVKDKEARRDELFSRIDRRMRSLYDELNEYGAELNTAHPVFGRSYAMVYFGDLAGLVLGKAVADYRTFRQVERDLCDHVSFRYQLLPPTPLRVDLMGHDLPRFRERLDAARVVYEIVERKNDFGQATRATATLEAISCGLLLRADYDAAVVAIELRSIRRLGNATLSMSLDDFTDEVFDALVQYAFGLDDAFEARLRGD